MHGGVDENHLWRLARKANLSGLDGVWWCISSVVSSPLAIFVVVALVCFTWIVTFLCLSHTHRIPLSVSSFPGYTFGEYVG